MKSIVSLIATAAAVVSLGVHADEVDDLLDDGGSTTETTAASSDETEASTEEGGEAAEGEAGEGESADGAAKKPGTKIFHLLPFCREVEGRAEVLIPGSSGWTEIVDGKYYPLGTTYRTVGAESRLQVEFGPECSVSVRGDSSFGTRRQKIEERIRALDLVAGTITVKLPAQMPEGAFSVNAPGFTVKNPVGESRYTYRKTGDGDEAVIRCVTQKLTLVGPHFTAPVMRAANEIRIVTSQDQLTTALHGSRGDFVVRLDQGMIVNKDYATGETKIEPKYLDWKLSPQTVVRIHRSMPRIGSRMAVTVMTFDARGDLHNRCAFTERMVEVNSGELGPTSKKEREELAKRAAEIAKSQEHAGAASETSDADVSEEETEEEADSGSDAGGGDDDDLAL